jgi:hypothetical protein
VEGSFDAAEFERFRSTQAALVKAAYVLEAALRPAEISEIPAVQRAESPITWLRDKLVIDFPNDSEIMRIRLLDPQMSFDELEALLDSVKDAYLRDVVEQERIEKLRAREIVELLLEKTSNELDAKREEYHALAKEIGPDESAVEWERDLVLEDYGRNRAARMEIEHELMEHELKYRHALLEPDADAEELQRRHEVTKQVLAARVATLDDERLEIQERLKSTTAVANAELQRRRDEIRHLCEVVDAMRRKLHSWNVEMLAGSRVRSLHDAVAFDSVEGIPITQP